MNVQPGRAGAQPYRADTPIRLLSRLEPVPELFAVLVKTIK
jgi:hypothetical protein